MKHHKSLTIARITDAAEREMFGLDNPGFCIVCGEEREDCEPDARGYECESCGTNTVYGAAELLMSMG